MFLNSSKKNQNILKILSCIENVNFKARENCMYIRSFFLELNQEPKSILRKNSRFSSIFMLFFSALLKTIGNFKL